MHKFHRKEFFYAAFNKVYLLVKLRTLYDLLAACFSSDSWHLLFFAFGNLNDADFETVQVAMVQETSPNPLFSFYIEQVQKK